MSSSKNQMKKEYDAEYRAKRKRRKFELIELHHSIVEAENKKDLRLHLNLNFVLVVCFAVVAGRYYLQNMLGY